MINATWLETFTTLCETGHFTQAAQRLNMTQPGVSQHLRKLETQVGRPLVVQEGKRFSLTPAGEAVLDLGRSRRMEERRLREQIEGDDPDIGEVRIACSGSFATLLYPRARTIMQNAPDLCIHLEAAPQTGVLEGLVKNSLDLGVLGYDPKHPLLDAQRIGQEELCLVLNIGAPEPVTFDSLQTLGFVAHPDGFGYADELFSLNFPDEFSGAGDLRRRTFVNQIGQIPTPVADGIGYTLLPRSGVEAFIDKDRLKLVSLPHRCYHELWLVTRRRVPLKARVKRMAQEIRKAAESLG